MNVKDIDGRISAFAERACSYVLRKFSASIPFGGRYCCYCFEKSLFFMPYRLFDKRLPPLIKVLDVVGSDLDNHLCPKCQSHDRERHLMLYFDALMLQKYVANRSVLHFAPEFHFSKYIQAIEPANYIKADLYPTSHDIRRINMLATGFIDAEFDLVIANHVLEHVSDIEAALMELRRVLKPGGLAVFQTPYSKVLNTTFEDKGIVSPEARLQAFGQEDHVRLFGSDIFNFIASFGFESRVTTHELALANIDARYHGVNLHEPLFLFERLA